MRRQPQLITQQLHRGAQIQRRITSYNVCYTKLLRVIDGVNAFGGIVQPVGDRRRGRLVEQAENVQARKLRRVLGRLALGVVEISYNFV